VKEDFDVDDELGFEPAVSATGGDPGPRTPRSPAGGRRFGRRFGRRLTAATILAAALVGTGAAYAAFAASSGASGTTSSAEDIAAGKQLYETSCITCHGANLQGVPGRGATLLGVGSAAVEFQVSTGRMPSARQGAQNERKDPKFGELDTQRLAAYVQSVGGGPEIPSGSLRDQDVAAGGALFRLNCASCHGTTFGGAPLSAGKTAPGLKDATDRQMWGAMITGPESMPIFSDNQITPLQKRQIISYVQTLKASDDPGGAGIDRIGPVSEAIVLWVGGVGALMIAILWIGAKTQ
jgi:ubiquinol-cytochrome c reductase cytochrome c subunit